MHEKARLENGNNRKRVFKTYLEMRNPGGDCGLEAKLFVVLKCVSKHRWKKRTKAMNKNDEKQSYESRARKKLNDSMHNLMLSVICLLVVFLAFVVYRSVQALSFISNTTP